MRHTISKGSAAKKYFIPQDLSTVLEDAAMKTRVSETSCYTLLFYKQRFLSTQPQCCLTCTWFELRMLLRCYLIHKSILRHFFYLLYLSPYLDLGVFLPYFCDIFFISIFIQTDLNRSCLVYMFFAFLRKLFFDEFTAAILCT